MSHQVDSLEQEIGAMWSLASMAVVRRALIVCYAKLQMVRPLIARGLIALSFVVAASSNAAATWPPSYVVSGVVEGVSDESVISIRGRDGVFRLWGIHADGKRLRLILVGQTISCVAVAELIVDDEPIPIMCREKRGEKMGRSIQGTLIELGEATENCEESGGMFRQCSEGRSIVPLGEQATGTEYHSDCPPCREN